MYYIAPRRLADAATGRLQVFRLYARHNPVYSSPLQIFNLYFSASTHSAKRAPLPALLQLRRPKEDMHTIAVGDYNFIEQLGDHTPEYPALRLDNSTKRIWDRIMTKISLSELSQPVHTYYHVTDFLTTTRTYGSTGYIPPTPTLTTVLCILEPTYLTFPAQSYMTLSLYLILVSSRTWARHLLLVDSPLTCFLSRSASLHPTGCDVPTDRILPSGWRPTLTYQ
jgi:hypothetical protein